MRRTLLSPSSRWSSHIQLITQQRDSLSRWYKLRLRFILSTFPLGSSKIHLWADKFVHERYWLSEYDFSQLQLIVFRATRDGIVRQIPGPLAVPIELPHEICLSSTCIYVRTISSRPPGECFPRFDDLHCLYCCESGRLPMLGAWVFGSILPLCTLAGIRLRARGSWLLVAPLSVWTSTTVWFPLCRVCLRLHQL